MMPNTDNDDDAWNRVTFLSTTLPLLLRGYSYIAAVIPLDVTALLMFLPPATPDACRRTSRLPLVVCNVAAASAGRWSSVVSIMKIRGGRIDRVVIFKQATVYPYG